MAQLKPVKRKRVFIDLVCSKCGGILVTNFAYGYEPEVVVTDPEFLKIKHEWNYCKWCGADMREGDEA